MKLFTRSILLVIAALFGSTSEIFAASSSGVGLALFADGLTNPVAKVQAPNSFFYVAELGGKIRVLHIPEHEKPLFRRM